MGERARIIYSKTTNEAGLLLHFATFNYGDNHAWFSRRSALFLNLPDYIHSFNDMTKDDMLVVEPIGFFSANKELRSVRI